MEKQVKRQLRQLPQEVEELVSKVQIYYEGRPLAGNQAIHHHQRGA